LLYQLYAPHPVDMNPFKAAFEDVLRLEKGKGQNEAGPATTLMVATLEVILSGKGAQVRSQQFYSTRYSMVSSPQLSALSPTALASGSPKLGGETVSPR
jgi:hypothetical protein